MATIYSDPGLKRTPLQGKGLAMITERPVLKGTLLSLDFLITGSHDECCEKLQAMPSLAEQLYPRDGPVHLKVALNTFDRETGSHYLGETLSFYNHGCEPNAGYCFFGTEFLNSKWGTVYALEDIPANTEVTVFYGPLFGHFPTLPRPLHSFTCDCTSTEDERNERNRMLSDQTREYIETNSANIGRLIALNAKKLIARLVAEKCV